MKIQGIDVDIEALRPLDTEHQNAVFAHLKGKSKKDAIAELQGALKKIEVKEAKAEVKAAAAEPPKVTKSVVSK